MNSAIVTTGAEHAASDVAREITSLSGSVLERVMRARSGELFAAQLAHQPLDVDIGPMPMHVVAYHIDGSTDVEKRVHGRVTGRRPRIGSVSLIPATSIDDYNSLNYLRAKVDLAKKCRLLAYKLFGMQKPLPDIGPRNVTELTCEQL